VAQKDLHGAEIARALVDQRRLGAPEGVGTVVSYVEADCFDPAVDETCILPGADVLRSIYPAREQGLVCISLSLFELGTDALMDLLADLGTDRSAGLLLDHCGPPAHLASHRNVSDPELHDITAAKLAVYRDVEESPVTRAAFVIRMEADRPILLRLEGALRANDAARVPRRPARFLVVVLRSCHDHSPGELRIAAHGRWDDAAGSQRCNPI
jgi:hypothetical protein